MSVSPVRESQLVAKRADSPRDRAAALYERHYERVLGYCLYKLGNRQEAEDAAQTTFLWALRGLARGIEPRMEANWLFTIAQNACRARIRTRMRKREQETLSDPQILERVAPGRLGSDDDLVGLTEALRDMPALQREAIILREWRGFSYKEIAAELELSSAAVETLIFRARRSLASRLENPNMRVPKRTKTFAFDFGSLVAACKSLLGLGGAAKIAAVAATVAAVGLGVGLEATRSDEKSPVVPAREGKPVAYAVAPSGGAPVTEPGRPPTKKHRHHPDSAGEKPTPADVGPSGEETQPTAPEEAGPLTVPEEEATPPESVVETTTASLPSAGAVLESATDDVSDLVDEANTTLDSVLPATSSLAPVTNSLAPVTDSLAPVTDSLP